MTDPTAADVVLRSRGRRLLRAVAVTGTSVVPAVVLAFAVRQQFDPVINADTACHPGRRRPSAAPTSSRPR